MFHSTKNEKTDKNRHAYAGVQVWSAWGQLGHPLLTQLLRDRQPEAVAEKTDTAMLSPKNRHAYAAAQKTDTLMLQPKKQTRLCYSQKNRHAYATVYARFCENVVSDREVPTSAFIIACLFFV